jgi:hypothetical protein
MMKSLTAEFSGKLFPEFACFLQVTKEDIQDQQATQYYSQ